ncbi:hypothetical protein HK104_005265 [Borealophlyctis nickersoniae]|nr:hypothetical protein HK104_005265 [Borealophlyctis nickersoniae]
MTSQREARLNRGTSKLGTYLLQGWVMMEQPCATPGCNIPLVRTKDRTRTMCVLCDDPQNPDRPPEPFTEVEDEGDEFPLAEADSAVGDVESVEVERQREQSQRASALLGQRMLAGWTLLGENCQSAGCFGIPLVRNRQKQKQCVICESWYSDGSEVEEDGGKLQEAQKQHQPEIASKATRNGQTSPSAMLSGTSSSKPVEDPKEPAPIFRMPDLAADKEPASATFWKVLIRVSIHKHQDAGKKRKLSSAPSSAPLAAYVPLPATEEADVSDEINQTISSLVKQMTVLRQRLDQSTSVSDIKSVCDAVASCAAAVAACQAVRRVE